MRCRIVPLAVAVAATWQVGCTNFPSSIDAQSTQGTIEVATDRSTYKLGETVTIVAQNKGREVVRYYDGPGCGLGFQRKEDGQWRPQFISSAEQGRAPCDLVTLNENEKGTIRRVIDLNPPSGAYRFVFRPDSGGVFDGEFTISP